MVPGSNPDQLSCGKDWTLTRRTGRIGPLTMVHQALSNDDLKLSFSQSINQSPAINQFNQSIFSGSKCPKLRPSMMFAVLASFLPVQADARTVLDALALS